MNRRYAERIGTFTPGSPEWHAARANGLGGSEIAAVMGLSPWTSRFTLWHRKTGLAEEAVENRGMSWGKRLEDPIARKFADDHPEMKMRRTGTWRSKARPWQIANPDRVLGTNAGAALLEIKTAHSMDSYAWGADGTDEIPVYYRTQCLWYMDVLASRECYLAVLIGGSDYRTYLIGYDAGEAALMRSAGEEFLDSVKAGTRPPIDESDSTYQTIRELHPDIDGTEKEVNPTIAGDYLLALADYRRATAAKQAASSALLDEMGSARYAVYRGERIAMRQVKGSHTPHLRALSRTEGEAA